jgi:hypothetical protein
MPCCMSAECYRVAPLLSLITFAGEAPVWRRHEGQETTPASLIHRNRLQPPSECPFRRETVNLVPRKKQVPEQPFIVRLLCYFSGFALVFSMTRT